MSVLLLFRQDQLPAIRLATVQLASEVKAMHDHGERHGRGDEKLTSFPVEAELRSMVGMLSRAVHSSSWSWEGLPAGRLLGLRRRSTVEVLRRSPRSISSMEELEHPEPLGSAPTQGSAPADVG